MRHYSWFEHRIDLEHTCLKREFHKLSFDTNIKVVQGLETFFRLFSKNRTKVDFFRMDSNLSTLLGITKILFTNAHNDNIQIWKFSFITILAHVKVFDKKMYFLCFLGLKLEIFPEPYIWPLGHFRRSFTGSRPKIFLTNFYFFWELTLKSASVLCSLFVLVCSKNLKGKQNKISNLTKKTKQNETKLFLWPKEQNKTKQK